MIRKTVIITVEKNGLKLKAWPTLRKLCKKRGYVYFTIVKKDLPITINDTTIHRLKFEK